MKIGDIYNTPGEFAQAMAEHFGSEVPDVSEVIMYTGAVESWFSTATNCNMAGDVSFDSRCYDYPVQIVKLPYRPVWFKPKESQSGSTPPVKGETTVNYQSPEAKKIPILDHGFIELVDHMGSDLTVVNAARVSFGKRKTEMSSGDEKLIKYLAEHQHWSPFRHLQFQFHIKVPEFLARQAMKHIIGAEYTIGGATNKDHAWNEISQRYVDAGEFDFYTPESFRKQAENNRQASTDETIPHNGIVKHHYKSQVNAAITSYKYLVESGVAREQARAVLPLCIYTEYYWTASLQAVVNFIKLRQHEGAQYEIRVLADAMSQLVKQVCPVSYGALLGEPEKKVVPGTVFDTAEEFAEAMGRQFNCNTPDISQRVLAGNTVGWLRSNNGTGILDGVLAFGDYEYPVTVVNHVPVIPRWAKND